MKKLFLLLSLLISFVASAYTEDLLLGSFDVNEEKTHEQKSVSKNEPSFLVGSFDIKEKKAERSPASVDEEPEIADYTFLQGSFQKD